MPCPKDDKAVILNVPSVMSKIPKSCCHEAIKPISWLIGKWKSSTGEGFYPTIKPFTYCEEITFESVGQPLLNYMSNTWDHVNIKPLHLERGFLRIKPGTNQVAFIIAHNLGATSIEEGQVHDCEIKLQSTKITSMSFVRDPQVCGLQRVLRMNEEGKLEMRLSMATVNTPMSGHLRIKYEPCTLKN